MVCNHANGLKQFTFKWMPRREEAIRKKPRGKEEMEKALTSCIEKGPRSLDESSDKRAQNNRSEIDG